MNTDQGPVDYLFGVSQLRGYERFGWISHQDAEARIAQDGQAWRQWALEQIAGPLECSLLMIVPLGLAAYGVQRRRQLAHVGTVLSAA